MDEDSKQRMRIALKDLDEHDEETRRLLAAGLQPFGTFPARDAHRRLLEIRLTEAVRFALGPELPDAVML